MSTHPYIPLYVDDYDSHTAHLTPEEDGVYGRLLRLSWRSPGCALPNDHVWIARKIRLSPEDYERIARPVIDEYFKLVRGRLVQRRLKAEYDSISCKQSARKLAGKKGGEAKARKSQDKSASKASDLPTDTRAFPEPNPEPEREDTKPTVSAPALPVAPPDPNKEGWARGVALLMTAKGAKEAGCRSFFGKQLSEFGLEARDMLPSIVRGETLGTPDPQGYLRRAAEAIAARRGAGAPPTPEARVAQWDEATWRVAVRTFRDSGRWGLAMGPSPDHPDCIAPPAVLAELGYSGPRAA